jgi:hypothetical protein
MVTESDIVFTYSGGSSNSNPAVSLGGDISTVPIANRILFSDITSDQAEAGRIDYRCFYLKNINNLEFLYDSSLSISYENPGDVTIYLGFKFSNERQTIFITNYASITSGSFVLSYEDSLSTHNRTIDWNSNPTTWANEIQSNLRTIDYLDDITVVPNVIGSNLTFEINFLGLAANRKHNLLEVSTNSLSPVTSVSITRTVSGSPINCTADEIEVSTVAPFNVDFVSEFSIGNLHPLDFIPVWVKRIAPVGTEASENDGFNFRLSGSPII